MPPHSSHLLQPLDVACFGPLKRLYSKQIENLVRCQVQHITKEDFLPAFKDAFDGAITSTNIRSGFRRSGLVPFGPDVVISKLDIRLRTPSRSPPLPSYWQSQTPHNATEIESQTAYIRQRLQRHQGSSPTSIIAGLDCLERGACLIAHGSSILRSQVGDLRTANETLTKRKTRKKKRVTGASTRSIEEGLQLLAQSSTSATIDQFAAAGEARVKGRRRCGICREFGHRRETCQQRQSDTLGSIDPTLLASS